MHRELNLMRWQAPEGNPDGTKSLYLKPAGSDTWRPYSNTSRHFETQRQQQLNSDNYSFERLTGGCQLPPLQLSDGFATAQQLLKQGWRYVDQQGNLV